MSLFGLSVASPFPYAILALATFFGGMSPPLCRHYSKLRWRIPLWHIFPLFVVIGVLCLLLPPYIRDAYEVKKLYWLFDNGFYPGPTLPSESQLAGLPYKLLPRVILELVILALIPGAIAAFVSQVLTKRRHRR